MHSTRHEEYVSPFSARYASPEMSYLFSPKFKISTFRKLWTALAKAEKKQGLPITEQQIAELEDNINNIDFEAAKSYEKRFRHDVMAHIHAYGDACPNAKSIIHLGATSSYVTDNTDLIQLKEGLKLLLDKLIHVLRDLASFAEKELASPCLGYTHYQAAQPTTMGKRACLWIQDLLLDAQAFEQQIASLPFLGVKGATGTQASFLALFNDATKIKEIEIAIAKECGFTKVLPIAGQTYTRKLDLNILNIFESFAASCHKMATDIRLLAHDGELSESFTDTQVGSSAMPYKRNPIYSERICGISRFVMSLSQNGAYTAATQWLERSLDDSSNRRLSIPESFLGVDAILNLLSHLVINLSFNHSLALSNLEAKIPQLSMENILMLATKKGADRQLIHDKLSKLSGDQILEMASELQLDPNELKALLTPLALIGRSPDQVREFLKSELYPFLSKYKESSAPIAPIEF